MVTIAIPPARTTQTAEDDDLVVDLVAESERIGDWLGVDLRPDIVEANRPDYDHHATSATPASSIGRWRQELTETEAQAVADGLRELAAPLGYEL